MTILFPRAGVSPDELVADARRLADDLAMLVEAGAPPADILASAPLLDFWGPALRSTGCLTGVVSGHPRKSWMDIRR